MKQEILNIKIKDFAKLKEDKRDDVYYITKNFLKPNPILRSKGKEIKPKVDSLWDLKFSEMIDLKEHAENKDFVNVIKLIFNIKEKDVNTLNVFNAFSSYKFIIDQLKEIVRAEENQLSGNPSQKEIAAGIDEFKKYGQYNTLRMLTNGDKTKEKHWLSLPYSEVFLELSYMVDEARYQKNLYKS